jgi:hypothetical protein
MWKLIEPLVTTAWALRTPIMLCALIFGGMAVLSEVSSWHERDAAYEAAVKACSGKAAQQGGKEASC